jgi:hypothetical protein
MSGIFWGASGLTGNLAMLCLLGYGEFCGRRLPERQSLEQRVTPDLVVLTRDLQAATSYRAGRLLSVISPHSSCTRRE